MTEIEYKTLKKMTIQQTGANDPETLTHFAEMMKKQNNLMKYLSILLILCGIPLSLIFFGIFFVLGGFILYFFVYRKNLKKFNQFIEHIKNDKEFHAEAVAAKLQSLSMA
jgi:Na+/melibiose symporter-like transporter